MYSGVRSQWTKGYGLHSPRSYGSKGQTANQLGARCEDDSVSFGIKYTNGTMRFARRDWVPVADVAGGHERPHHPTKAAKDETFKAVKLLHGRAKFSSALSILHFLCEYWGPEDKRGVRRREILFSSWPSIACFLGGYNMIFKISLSFSPFTDWSFLRIRNCTLITGLMQGTAFTTLASSLRSLPHASDNGAVLPVHKLSRTSREHLPYQFYGSPTLTSKRAFKI